MARYKMTAKELILTSGSAKGKQIKFYKDGYWYKIDDHGPAGKAEELSCKILGCSSLRLEEYVHYESCVVEYDGKTYQGCRSKDFLRPGEHLFSYDKIYELTTGRRLSEDIIPLQSPEERIVFVADAVKDFCGLDVREHIAKNLTVSMALMDTDRHFNNIGIIADESLTGFRNAPIFDNGAAFLSNYDRYPPHISVVDIASERVSITGKPFSANLEYQAVAAGINVRFDVDKVHKLLKGMTQDRMVRIAEYLTERYM